MFHEMHGQNRSLAGNTTRRQVLKSVGLLGLAAALSACGATAPASSPTVPAPGASTPKTATTVGSTVTGVATVATTAASAPVAQPTTAAAPAQPTAAAGVGVTTINWFLPLSAAPEIAIWTQFVTRLEAGHPDIKINGSYEAWGNYWTKLETVMAGGAIPDVVWLHYTRLAEWASKDVMSPLDPLLAADKIDPKQYVFNDAMVYQGKMYAIPKDNGINAMWYDRALFQKAGLPDPSFKYSWTDWLEASQKLTVDKAGKVATDPAFNPGATVQWGTVQPQTNSPRGEGFYSWFAALGGKLYSEDQKTTRIDQPESITALQFMADVINKQHAAPAAGAISQPGDPWLNQLIATTWAHHAEEFFYHEQKATFSYDEVYYPQGPNGEPVISGGTTGFAIPKQTKHRDQAWILTTFMTGEEQQKVIVGQHRWAAGRRNIVPMQYDKSYNTENYVKCHVDPLMGNGPQAVAPTSPAALARIEQVWGTALDPVWLGKQQAKDVVPGLKKQIDSLLQQPTRI